MNRANELAVGAPLDEQALALLLQEAPVGIVLADEAGTVTWVNAVAERQLKRPAEDLLGLSLDSLPLERTEHRQGQAEVCRVAGETATWVACTELEASDRTGGHRALFVVDVSAEEDCRRKVDQLQRALRSQASTDPATGLLNRRAAMSQLDAQVSRSRRYGNPFSVALLRLTRSDGQPQEGAEEWLVSVSRTLRDATRWPDIIGRWGPSDFLLVLPETPVDAAEKLMEKLRAALTDPCPEESCRLEFAVAEWSKGATAQRLLKAVAAGLGAPAKVQPEAIS